MIKDYREGELQLSQTKTVRKRAGAKKQNKREFDLDQKVLVVSCCSENYRRNIAQIQP